MLQEGQQGMTRVNGLEAAQQVSAICLLTQVEGDQLCPDLSRTCKLRIYLSLGRR